MSRLEIPLIFLLFYFFTSLIFKKNIPKILPYSIIILVIANILYLILSFSNLDQQADANKYEKPIFFHHNIQFRESNIYNNGVSDLEIKSIAKSRFIYDSKLDDITFESILKEKETFRLFFSKDFGILLLAKAYITLHQIITHNLFVLIAIFYLLFQQMFSTLIFSGLKIIRIIFLLIIIYIGINLSAGINEGFISIFLLFIFCLLLYKNIQSISPPHYFILILLSIGVMGLPYFYKNSIIPLKTDCKSSRYLTTELLNYRKNHKELYVGGLYLNEDPTLKNPILNNKIFAKNPDWKFIDYSIMNQVPLVQQELTDNFGKHAKRLDKKIEMLIHQNASIILETYDKDLYSLYLHKIYNYPIKFKKIKDIPNTKLAIYKPYLSDSKN
ncbi:MAG: hypothetical protein M9887_11135 [Chitinophagales bacterium]|nr:hypothetical protein [Chitinophagales bacterium]